MPVVLLNTFRFSVPVNITDSFNRANNLTTMGSTDGATVVAWEPLRGTWGIEANQGRNISSTADAVAVVQTNVTNQTASIVLATRGAAAGSVLVCRCSDVSNFYAAFFDSSGSTQIYKVVAGTATTLGATSSHTATAGDVLGFTTIGSTLTMYINSVSHLVRTDTDLTTGTKCGLRCDNDTVLFDTFSVTG